jgi:hypothetical protein
MLGLEGFGVGLGGQPPGYLEVEVAAEARGSLEVGLLEEVVGFLVVVVVLLVVVVVLLQVVVVLLEVEVVLQEVVVALTVREEVIYQQE